MFGYMNLSPEGLTEEQQKRYRAYYCGLCWTLKQRFGNLSRITLSNDMTFLLILLTSLYEPQEEEGEARCLPHPIYKRAFIQNEFSPYCADMNIALAYHKCQDDWVDDRSLVGLGEAKLLGDAYRKVADMYPAQCKAIQACLQEIGQVEANGLLCPDEPANLTARMLGSIFRAREDYWSDELQAMGEALGRFIYLMDAYDDLSADIRRGRYNPLKAYAEQDDYEEVCKDSMMLLIAECTAVFETMPLVMDVDILRNILYSGIWMRYIAKREKRKDKEKLVPKEDGR